MKLPELKELVDDWIATDDWNDIEVCIYDGDGVKLTDRILLSLEIRSNDDVRDVLVFESTIAS